MTFKQNKIRQAAQYDIINKNDYNVGGFNGA